MDTILKSISHGIIYYYKYYKFSTSQILHREDGPAIEYPSGGKEWIQNGYRHRLNGPAVEYANGRKRYFINGMEYSEKYYYKIIELSGKSSLDDVIKMFNVLK